MKTRTILTLSVVTALLGGCGHDETAGHEQTVEFDVTHPLRQNNTTVKEYVSQIRAIQHIEVRAMEKAICKTPLWMKGKR